MHLLGVYNNSILSQVQGILHSHEGGDHMHFHVGLSRRRHLVADIRRGPGLLRPLQLRGVLPRGQVKFDLSIVCYYSILDNNLYS